MKKRSIVGRIGVVAVALTVATTSLMSGTLAKYTTSKTLTTNALVAKWNPQIAQAGSQTDLPAGVITEETKAVDLISTVNNTNSYNGDAAAIKATAKNKAGKTLLVPGMGGEFYVQVDMTGAQVDTEYNIQIANPQTDGGTPKYSNPEGLEFKYEIIVPAGETGSTKIALTDEFTSIFGAGNKKYILNEKDAGAKGQKAVVKITWQWPMERTALPSGVSDIDAMGFKTNEEYNNAQDTAWVSAATSAAGTGEIPAVGFDIKVIATQATEHPAS